MLIASPRRPGVGKLVAGLAALLALGAAPVLSAGQAGAALADSAVSITDPTGDGWTPETIAARAMPAPTTAPIAPAPHTAHRVAVIAVLSRPL